MNMTSTSVSAATSRAFQPSFFFWMVLVMCFFVFAGFGMTYLFPVAQGTFPTAPPVVHLHGIVFFSWMILLLVQTSLVSAGNVKLHRSLGTYGIAHAAAILILGVLITLLSLGNTVNNLGGRGPFHAGFLAVMATFGFAWMFTLAIRNVRRPEVHKRMILFAMLPVIPPGVNRFYMVPLGLDTIPVYLLYPTLCSMAAAILIQEWRASGKIDICSRIGAGWIFVQALIHVPIVHSAPFTKLMIYLASLVHYR